MDAMSHKTFFRTDIHIRQPFFPASLLDDWWVATSFFDCLDCPGCYTVILLRVSFAPFPSSTSDIHEYYHIWVLCVRVILSHFHAMSLMLDRNNFPYLILLLCHVIFGTKLIASTTPYFFKTVPSKELHTRCRTACISYEMTCKNLEVQNERVTLTFSPHTMEMLHDVFGWDGICRQKSSLRSHLSPLSTLDHLSMFTSCVKWWWEGESDDGDIFEVKSAVFGLVVWVIIPLLLFTLFLSWCICIWCLSDLRERTVWGRFVQSLPNPLSHTILSDFPIVIPFFILPQMSRMHPVNRKPSHVIKKENSVALHFNFTANSFFFSVKSCGTACVIYWCVWLYVCVLAVWDVMMSEQWKEKEQLGLM